MIQVRRSPTFDHSQLEPEVSNIDFFLSGADTLAPGELLVLLGR